jgi:ABC-type sugar transport system ATPase subunit
LLKQGMGRNEVLEQTGNMVAVNNVSLSVRAGEIFVIMGLSGSGKSTLVRLLNRLIEPTSGQVILEGRDIAPMSTLELREVRRKKMAMVFQSFALLPNRTVLDNIAYGLEVAGIPKPNVMKWRARCWCGWAWVPTISFCPANCPVACSSVWVWLAPGGQPVGPADGRGLLRAGPADPLRNAERAVASAKRRAAHHRVHFTILKRPSRLAAVSAS